MTDYNNWLSDWFRRRAPQINLGPDDNFFTVGAIDSFGVIELIEEMEQTFFVRFTQEDFQDRRFPSITGLSAMLAEKGAA